MNGHGKSDSSVVPKKSPNKAGHAAAAEEMEGRGLAQGNLRQQNASRTQRRNDAHRELEQVRLAVSCTAARALSPKAGAGCGSSARPDLWRGSRATVIPTPTACR